MTEKEWLDCQVPDSMFRFLPGKGLDRKYRLIACACVWRLWELFDDDRPRRALVIAEQYADGKATTRELRAAYLAAKRFARKQERLALWSSTFQAHAAHQAASPPDGKLDQYAAFACATSSAGTAAIAIAGAARGNRRDSLGDQAFREAEVSEQRFQADLIRDILGNPFQPIVVDFQNLEGGVKQVASEIYSEKAFDRLPALATLIENTGYHDTNITDHLRYAGSHVRGCWALDLILGYT